MKKTLERLFLGACLAAMFGGVSAEEEVATLSQLEGFVVASKGARYIRAHEGMKLKEGARLMVMEGGRAVISFADGCEYGLTENEILTIGPTSTCVSDAVGLYRIDPYRGVSQDPNVAANAYKQAAVRAGRFGRAIRAGRFGRAIGSIRAAGNVGAIGGVGTVGAVGPVGAVGAGTGGVAAGTVVGGGVAAGAGGIGSILGALGIPAGMAPAAVVASFAVVGFAGYRVAENNSDDRRPLSP